MSWLSKKTGIHLGNLGAPIGALVGSVIPGVGTSIGAGLGQGFGALGQKKSVGRALFEGVGAYGAAKALPSGSKSSPGAVIRNFNGYTPSFGPTPPGGGGGVPTYPGGGGTPDVGSGDASPWWQQALGGIGDYVKKGASAAMNNPLNTAMIGLAGAQAIAAGKQSARAGKLQDEAIGGARDRWASQAPLRAKAIAGLLNPTKSDLSSTFYDPNNPFAAKPRPIAAPPVTAQPPGGSSLPMGPPPPRPVVPQGQLPMGPVPPRAPVIPGSLPTGPVPVRRPLLLPRGQL